MKFFETGSKFISLENVRTIELKNKKVLIRYTDGETEKIKHNTKESARQTYICLQYSVK